MAASSSLPPDGEGRPQVYQVDGPMLPHLNHLPSTAAIATADGGANPARIIPPGSTSLMPVVTPTLPSSSSRSFRSDDDDDDDDDDAQQQYLLVPNAHRIVVRSARRGRRVCDLLPTSEREEGAAVGSDIATFIRAMVLTWLPRRRGGKGKDHDDDNDDDGDDECSSSSSSSSSEGVGAGEWIVLAACSDGSVQEWPMADLSSSPGASEKVVGPRRSFKLTCPAMKDTELIHLVSVQDHDASKLVSEAHGGALLYGLVVGEDDSDGEKSSSWLVRCVVPPFTPRDDGETRPEGDNDEDEPSLPLQRLVPTKRVKKSKSYEEEASKGTHVCLRKEDIIFGLLAAYRPSSRAIDDGDGGARMDYEVDDGDDDAGAVKGDVFVAMCASHGLVVCRDGSMRREGDNLAPRSLVHFTKLTKPSESYSTLSSVAVSPNARDLALGRANGRIEVLDNLFANIASHLDDDSEDLTTAERRHPEGMTVRRTVHWHAHPVRALSYLAAGGRHNSRGGGANGGPSTLLSGGEESVLVTWHLDRNAHRPSGFVARVSHGAIVSVLCCPRRNKVYVFTSDDSVQRYDGSNYECDWRERGLAAAALSRDGERGEERGGGAVVMVHDPITGLPMLTNLPGAPGMVHWYDPRSASVAGTLEVAPYNRVSKRDPSDPHVPAPIVTHLAVGKDGRDMVTVDAVWTENSGVGAGPRGTSVHACTSIKFWTYVDQPSRRGRLDRGRRRSGDVPMAYELVSSMVAPHGIDGMVSALSVSPDGKSACTLSREEGAFRMWVKGSADGGGAALSFTAPWKCLYRVRTPAGYANLLSRTRVSQQRSLAFSPDGTILAVSYGQYATLWDHTDATLLTSVALDNDNEESEGIIKSADFLTGGDDALLMTTAGSVGVASPFGGARSCYLGEDEWSCELGRGSIVTAAIPLPDRGTGEGRFAVAVASSNGDGTKRSAVSIVSRDGNVASANGLGPLLWRFDGEVRSLCVDELSSGLFDVRLLAITGDCRMLSLGVGPRKDGRAKGRESRAMFTDVVGRAPVLKLGTATDDSVEPSAAKRRKVSICTPRGVSGKEPGVVVSGFSFPNTLSGKFTSAFIARSWGMSRE